MSIEEGAPAISKEEKKRLKEEKRARKAAKAAAASGTSGESTPAEKEKKEKKRKSSEDAVEETVKEKKEKRDKKKKSKSIGADGDAQPSETVGGADEPPKKKTKKSKTEETEESATPAESSVPSAEEPTPVLSKKQQKKLAKAQAAATNTSTGPSSSVPSISIEFTAEHNTYLTSQNITLTPSVYPPILSIPSLPIDPALQPFLKSFSKPTPIQACSWPALLAKRDVVGIAETGSGKTLSFGVPGLNHVSSLPPVGKKGKGQIAMLVLAPTRELAQQSHDTISAFGKSVGINSVCLFGGVGKYEQINELKKGETRIVVGTPGRTLDLADAGDLDLSSVSYLVLDEADRMLDQGFENDIRRIIAHTPDHTKGRQTVMFSATWPESVRRLASSFLNDPIRITVGSDELSANKRIEQVVEVLDNSRDKDGRLLYHLRNHLKAHPNTPTSPTRILVFALYKKEAQRLEYTIRKANYNVGALHGDMTQDARFKALDLFKTGKQNVLVATDVAARGLDIPDVGLVINVTFPLTTEDFVHRCGRTGRAGKTGKAVTFFTGENHEKSLAGEFMRVLRDAGADVPKEMDRFPTTIKKKEHGSYGAFYKDTSDAPAATKITFD
ncbi:ATP-dependent RNA helicase DBP3 [Kwoniella sp. B9012]